METTQLSGTFGLGFTAHKIYLVERNMRSLWWFSAQARCWPVRGLDGAGLRELQAGEHPQLDGGGSAHPGGRHQNIAELHDSHSDCTEQDVQVRKYPKLKQEISALKMVTKQCPGPLKPNDDILATQDTNDTRVKVEVEAHSWRQHKQTFDTEVH